MERASRLIVIASIGLAGATHAWLAAWHPWLPVAAGATFVCTFLLARQSLTRTLAPIAGAIYLMPGVYYVAMGASPLSTDFQLTLVWLAAIAGPIAAHADFARWHLPERWMLPLVAWALVLAITWPIVAAREIDFSLIAARTFDTTNALSGAPPRMAAAWIVIMALAQMIGILWIDLLWARFGSIDLARFERWVIVPIVAGTSLGAAVGLYQRIVDLDWMNSAMWSRLGRASGLMLDANTFGIGTAIWAPAAVVLAWRLRRPVWIGVLFYGLLSAAMWTAGSRTALLAWATGTCGLLVAVAQRKGVWQPRVAQTAALVGAAVVVLAMFIAPRGGNSPSPLQRVFDRLPRPEAAELRRFADEMFWDRFGYGRAAIAIIADHPLTGVGIGAFHVVVNDYFKPLTGETLRADNAQNWWRHQLAELGVVGALPSWWMSLILVALVWKSGPAAEPPGATTTLRLVIAGVGFASVLGVPTQNPATWFSLAALIVWLAALYGSAPESTAPGRRPPIGRGTWVAALAIALVAAAGQAVSARRDLRVPVRALHAGTPYKYGFGPTEGFSQYGFLRWSAAHAVEVTPVEQPWLQLAVYPRENQDVAARPLSVRVWMNQRPVITHTFETHEPSVHFLQLPPNDKWIMLELDASGSIDDRQAVRVAHEWLRELPRQARPDQVVR